jgi:hypothetical protein
MAAKRAESTSTATGAAQGSGTSLSIAAHPRAVYRIKQAKGWGGLLGFLLGGYMSLPTHTLADAGFRALLAGAGCYVIVWAAAVFLWRGLIVAELRSREHQLLSATLAGPGIPGGPAGPGAASIPGGPSGAANPGAVAARPTAERAGARPPIAAAGARSGGPS